MARAYLLPLLAAALLALCLPIISAAQAEADFKYSNFIVVKTPRSGSTMLNRWMNAHPHIEAFFEPMEK